MKYCKTISLLFISAIIPAYTMKIKASDEISFRTLVINKPFTGVVASTGYVIEYTDNLGQKKASKALINGEEDYINNITYYVDEDGCLHFENTKDKNSAEAVTIKLNGHDVTTYIAESLGKINILSTIVTENNLTIKALSMGFINIGGYSESVQKVDLSASSGGSLNFQGGLNCRQLNINVDAGGSIFIPFIKGNVIELAANSMGQATIHNISGSILTAYNSANSKIRLVSCKTSELEIIGMAGGVTSAEQCDTNHININASSGSQVICEGKTKTITVESDSNAEVNIDGLEVEDDPQS